MKKVLFLLCITCLTLSARAQTPIWAGKTAAQGNTFLSPYTGTWNGSVVGGTYGGTGVNNGANTLTLGGNLTTSGAYTCTLTLTGTTSVTLPTSGTLVNTGVATLASLSSIGTITTGVWNGTKIAEVYGGTNQSAYTTGDILFASASNTLSKLGIGSSGNVLSISGGIPAWVSPTSTTVTTITADQTASVNVIYVNNKSGSQLVLTLPSTAAVGTEIEVIGGSNTAGAEFKGISGSIFHAGTTTGTTGTGAYISSSDQYGTCMIICIVASTEWEIVTSSGGWSIN